MIVKTKTISNSKVVDDHQSTFKKQQTITFPLSSDQGAQCRYINHISFSNEGSSVDNFKISISNNICKDNGEILEKATTIRFNNQVVTIKDFYEFTNGDLLLEEDSSSRKDSTIKMQNMLQSSFRKKRVAKNLAKNFLKAFLNYLEGIQKKQSSVLIQKKAKILRNKAIFSHSLIERIIDDQELEPYFLNFLHNNARSWILRSRIREKQIHLEAIKIFMNLSKRRATKNRSRASLNQMTPEGSLEMTIRDLSNLRSGSQIGSLNSQVIHKMEESV